MLDLKVKDIAGLPAHITKPVCVLHQSYLKGEREHDYEVCSRATAHATLQIGEFKQELQLRYDSGDNHNDFTAAFVPTDPLMVDSPIISIGNTLACAAKPFIKLISQTTDDSSDYFQNGFDNYIEPLSEAVGVDVSTYDIARLSAVLMSAYLYFIDSIVKTNLHQATFICESVEGLVEKSVDELVDFEIVWDVITEADMKPQNRQNPQNNPFVRDQVLLSGRTRAMLTLEFAKQDLESSKKDLKNAKVRLEENATLIKKNTELQPELLSILEGYAASIGAEIGNFEQEIEERTERFSFLKDRVALYNKAILETDDY